MGSDNEKRAKELGISLKKYKDSSEYKYKKSNKKSEEKATKKIKKYYKEKKETAESKAKVDIKRLTEDLNNIYKEAGIAKTRAIEDYNTNIGNIEEKKTLDVDTLNEYVATNKTRTQEDLDTSLSKESRRYSLEYDKINEDLAARGLTFSERKDEQIAKESSAINVSDIQRESQRSFQDIARYETAKTAEMNLKYGQATEAEEISKTRSLEDIANAQTKAIQSNTRDVQDINTGLKDTLREISYGKDTDVATTSQLFESNLQEEQDRQARIAVLGY